MRKFLALLLTCWVAAASAQVAQTGAGKGAPGTTYVGPGEVAATGSAFYWAGVRCYTKAYSGNVADVYSSGDATNTLITCSNGQLVTTSPTDISSVCSGTCTVKTLYDQSGNTNCTATPCDFVQATEANRPTFNLNCIGALPCMTFPSSRAAVLSTANSTSSPTCPAAMSGVYTRNANFTSFRGVFETLNGNIKVAFWSTASTGYVNLGSGTPQFTISDSTLHSVQFVIGAGASDNIVVDGTAAAPGNVGSLCYTNRQSLGVADGNNPDTIITEWGAWNNVTWTSTEWLAMQANQKAYWGTP